MTIEGETNIVAGGRYIRVTFLTAVTSPTLKVPSRYQLYEYQSSSSKQTEALYFSNLNSY